MPPYLLIGGFFISILEIRNLTKEYIIKEKETKKALDNVNFSFPSCGLVSILGKSGSGKSTLLNMISLMDKPSSGDVFYNGKSIFSYKEKEQVLYRNQQIGIVCQHYNLLEDETALYNVALPLVMSGEKEKAAFRYALKFFKSFSLNEKLAYKKVSLLSGGEKQRISILRAVINNPRLILCDEPTGAVDSENSILIMNILKKLSERHLVIMITHNEQLANQYSNKILYLENGKFIAQKTLLINNVELPIKKSVKKVTNNWTSHRLFKNLKKRKRRNIFSISALSFCLLATLLVVGFNYGSGMAIKNEGLKQFDYGTMSISKELNYQIDQSKFSVTQVIRPSIKEMNNLSNNLEGFVYDLNFDALLQNDIKVSIDNSELKNLSLKPIYDYDDNLLDYSLLYKGRIPSGKHSEVLINDVALTQIEKELGTSPINKTIDIVIKYESRYLPDDLSSDYIVDDLELFLSYKIVGVVRELSFLQTPKIFYSYVKMCDEISNIECENLSLYLNKKINWYDRIYSAGQSENITSFSYYLFFLNYKNYGLLEDKISCFQKPYSINANGITISNALKDVFQSISLGLEIFLIIAIIGSILILGIVSLSSYIDDKKESAIFTSLGSKKDSIISLYLNENLFICFISMVISFLLAPLIELLANKLVYQNLNIRNIISIPFFNSFNNVPFCLIIIVLISLIFITLIATIIPISFTKKLSIKEELQSL